MLCSSRLRKRPKGKFGFPTTNTNQDVIGMLGPIHGICFQLYVQSQVVYIITQENKKVDCFFQRKYVTTDTYKDNF